MKLKNCEEIIGTLDAVDTDDDHIRLELISKKTSIIPLDSIPSDVLKQFIGDKISIFRLDDRYYLKCF